MLKLMPSEAVFFEGFLNGKTIQQIAKEININGSTAYSRVKRMVEIGAVNKHGTHKKYYYVAVEQPFEVIARRQSNRGAPYNTQSHGSDDLLDNLVQYQISEEQINKIKELYNGRNRREVAQSLGMTKLQFNHAIATTKCLSSQFMK
jgi:DNA-binding Lrp family transcriptional regulator